MKGRLLYEEHCTSLMCWPGGGQAWGPANRQAAEAHVTIRCRHDLAEALAFSFHAKPIQTNDLLTMMLSFADLNPHSLLSYGYNASGNANIWGLQAKASYGGHQDNQG